MEIVVKLRLLKPCSLRQVKLIVKVRLMTAVLSWIMTMKRFREIFQSLQVFTIIPGKKHTVYLIDTPGDDNFLNETLFASHVTDCALFTVGAVLGVKGQTVKFANIIKDRNLPTIIAINKMDRERANFSKTVDEIKDQLPINAVVLHMPIGAEDDFKGYVDLITGKAYLFDGDKGGVKATDVPADLESEIETLREQLMESVAETDDDLIEKFLEEGELTAEELVAGLKKGVAEALIAPVCVCAATVTKGIVPILDVINDFAPSPEDRPAIVATKPDSDDMVEITAASDQPFSALVFKTMADPYAGRLTIFRVYSGILSGDSFYNSSKKHRNVTASSTLWKVRSKNQ